MLQVSVGPQGLPLETLRASGHALTCDSVGPGLRPAASRRGQ